MKTMSVSSILFVLSLSLNAQPVYDSIKEKAPKDINGFELAETSLIKNGDEPQMIVSYNSPNDGYISVTFVSYSADIINRFKQDIARAPESYEDDEMIITKANVVGNETQITYEKGSKLYEGSLVSEKKELLITFAGSEFSNINEVVSFLKGLIEEAL